MKALNLFIFFTLPFFSMATLADDLRPISLNINTKDNKVFSIVWKIPSKKNKRMPLSLEFDDNAIMLKPKEVHFYGNAFVEHYTIKREKGLKGLKIKVRGLQYVLAEVLLRFNDKDGNTKTIMLNATQDTFELDGTIEADNSLSTYIVLGIKHILVGLDHLLFIACLFFIAGTKRKLLYTVTGFTIAHSLTLILSSMGILSVPVPPVEAVIALSIVFLAVEIAKNNQDGLSLKHPVLVSTAFGLLHGLGFATVLAEIGLPPNEKVSALLYFNIGVEIGQLVFITTLFILYKILIFIVGSIKKEKVYLLVSYSSGTVAMSWLLARLSNF